MKIKSLFLFFLLFICSIAYGQSDIKSMSSLTVKVTEAGNGNPIQMATVYIVPAGDTLATAFSFTDKKGVAALRNFAAGRYLVNVQLLGFKPYVKELTLKPQTFRNISVALEENVEELEGASITEMGDLVTVKGDTLIYNATSFHTASNANLEDLLKKMPGVEVEKGRVKVNGEAVKRITVDGKTFFFEDQSKILESLPAVIVNQIRVIDKDNQGRFGLFKKEKEMDVRLKDEYKEAWFGIVSAEGGASVKDKSTDRFGDGMRGLYNAKLYAQFYGDEDRVVLIGGGNNVNVNQLSRTASGLSDVVSCGVDYNTYRIPGYNTNASASYDFRSDNNRSESHRTSFLSSGDRLETKRSQTNNNISHSTKANFSIGPQMFESYMSEGFSVNARFLHKRQKIANKNNSLTSDSAGEELNGSESRTDGNTDNYKANVGVEAKYFIDSQMKHKIAFGGDLGYDGTIGNSLESSVTRFRTSSHERSFLYTDKADGIDMNAYIDYFARLSPNWDIHSVASADFSSSKENRDARNAEDSSRNDYYSRYAKDRKINIKQSIFASYGARLGEQEYFRTGFGLGIYEDNIFHSSKAFGTEENSNALWQVNVGPVFRISFRNQLWDYSLYTQGKSVAPPYGADVSTMLDVSNPIDISTGNIYLQTGYHQDVNLAVSRGSRSAGSHYMGIRFTGSIGLKELTRASWYDQSAVRYSIPVNAMSPRYNASLNITYIQPLNKRKSLNLTITPKAFFSTGTNYVSDGPLSGIDTEKFDYADMMKWLYGDKKGSEFYSGRSGFMENRIHNLNWSVNADLKYELRFWSIRCGASVINSRSGYSAYPDSKVNNWRYNAYAEALWQGRNGWEVEGRFDFNGYSGFSQGYNRPDYLLNLKVAKAVKSFTIILSAYDILGSSKSFSHISSAEYIEDTYRNNVGRCIFIGLSYNFGKWNFAGASKMKVLERSNNL